MATKLEIEHKYLIKFPGNWAQLAELFDSVVDIKRISQTYLIPKDNKPAARVRKTIEGLTGETNTVYHFNQKKPVKTGIHEETEFKISEKEYEKYLKEANPKKHEVFKTRFVFKYHDQIFELDLFKGRLKGLAILEIELKKEDDVVEMPEFFTMLKEITGDKSYTNFALADK